MADLVPAEDIERIVGATRHPFKHIARAVSAEQTVYILHARGCIESTSDLRKCRYSLALDFGISLDRWRGWEDRPVIVAVHPVSRHLIPLRTVSDETGGA